MYQLPIVGAHVFITPSTGEPFAALFHQMTCEKSENQNESLALPFQLMENGTPVNLTPKRFNSVEGTNGTQSFSIEEESCPL